MGDTLGVKHWPATAILAAVVSACGPHGVASTVSDGGDSGRVDAGRSCEDPSATPNVSCGTLSWSPSPVMSRLRNHHLPWIASSDAGATLYVAGGVDQGALVANVDAIRILGDGSLGAWTSVAPLPVATAGMTGGLIGNVVVIAGGATAGVTVTDATFFASVQEDGTLGAWADGGSLFNPRQHAGSFVADGAIYVLGGYQGIHVWNDVVRATVSANGALSPWAPAGTLPGPRSHFAVSFANGYVYMTGGLEASALNNPPVLPDVVRGHIATDGTLGEWTSMNPLPVELASHAGFIYGGFLYACGGISNTTIESRCWQAPIKSDATLGAWEQTASLPIARSHVHELPLWKNHVYSVGGAIDYYLDSTSEIDIGTFQ